MEKIIIRQAEDKDICEIKAIVKDAFFRPNKNSCFNEWEFVDQVRYDSGFIPELSLVASKGMEIVGYVLLSKSHIGTSEGLALGPLTVKKSHQRQGIGKRLIYHALEKAKENKYQL